MSTNRPSRNIQRILFYTSIPRVFRTTLIGYVYELAQEYPVVLLSEQLDEQSERALLNKALFPKLEAVIPVSQYPTARKNIFLQNRALAQQAQDVVNAYKPDVVITANDVYPFELYLHRAAKRIGATTMCFQGSYRIAEAQEIKIWDRTLFGNSLFRKTKKFVGHMVYYWLFPILLGQLPFGGKSSFVRLEDDTGFRVDWSVVFSKRDYDICMKEGIPQKKLLLLDHPIRRNVKKVFEVAYGKRDEKPGRHITFLLPNKETGLRKHDVSFIPPKEIWESRRTIIALLHETFPAWNIWIKPHPSTTDVARAKKELESISSLVHVVDASEPADTYIGKSKVVVGIPIDSTALFAASMQSAETVVISADIHGELLGDSFQNAADVTYVQTVKQLREVLEKVQQGEYEGRVYTNDPNSFTSAAQVVAYARENSTSGI